MKKSTIRTIVLSLGVAVFAGLGTGIIDSSLSFSVNAADSNTVVSSTKGADTADEDDTDPFNPITADDLIVPVDWSAVSNDIRAAMITDDRNVKVMAGAQYTIPTNILNTLVQNRKVLMLHAGNNLAVSVSSEDVKTGSALKLDISKSIDIPQEAYDKVYGIVDTFTVKEDSVIPFKVDVHVTVGEDYADKYAVLYRYHKTTNSLVASGVFKVTGGGNAMFALRSNGQYVVAISDDFPQISTRYVVSAGNTLTKIARQYEVSLKSLLQANPQIKDADVIRVGQELNVW